MTKRNELVAYELVGRTAATGFCIMRRKQLRKIAILIVTAATVAATGATAQTGAPVGVAPQSNSKLPGNVAAPSGSKPAPGNSVRLTSEECQGLGGKVVTVDASTCATTQKCVTTDKNGVIHTSCVNATAH